MILNGIELRIDTKVADRLKSTELDAVRRDLTTDEIVCIMAFLNWKAEIEADYDLETIATETNVFSDIHNYAGTADWLVRLTPKPEGDNPLKFAGPTPFVIDFKTSQDIWDSHELQVSSYRVALENGENPLHERNANGTDFEQACRYGRAPHGHPPDRLPPQQGGVQVHRDRGPLRRLQGGAAHLAPRAHLGKDRRPQYPRLHAAGFPHRPLSGATFSAVQGRGGETNRTGGRNKDY